MKIETINKYVFISIGWLVGWFGFNGPLKKVFQSISGRLPKEREKEERKDKGA